MPHRLRPILLACLVAPAALADGPKPTEEQVRFFETKVRPVLVEHCVKCHGPEKQKAGLRLDSRAAVLAGGDTGPAVVPGKPEESLLVTAIRHERRRSSRCRRRRSCPTTQIADLTRWVEMGAPWPGDARRSPRRPRREGRVPDHRQGPRPLGLPAGPPPGGAGGARTRPGSPTRSTPSSSPGSRRRGLRPNPPAVEARADPPRHLRPDRPAADARGGRGVRRRPVARRLRDAGRPPARLAPLRREVGPALARPRPLRRDQQLRARRRQAATPGATAITSSARSTTTSRTTASSASSSPATSCPTATPTRSSPPATTAWASGTTSRPTASRRCYDGLDDIVATTGQVFLGLTVDCARCHDHKIDPIPQKDYYRLVSFFRNINHYRNGGPTDEAAAVRRGARRQGRLRGRAPRARGARATRSRRDRRDREGLPSTGDRAAERPRSPEARDLAAADPRRGARSSLGKDAVERLRDAAQAAPRRWRPRSRPGRRPSASPRTGRKAPETFVLLRGNPHVPGRQGRAGLPHGPRRARARRSRTPPPGAKTTRPAARAGRLDRLARQPADGPGDGQPASGSTISAGGSSARRATSASQGDRPTHPELLDWLAAEFVAQGWRLKPLHRLILTSNAYRMSSRAERRGAGEGPGRTTCFWRFDMRRLTAEEIRDSILAVSGTLNLKMYGPGVYPEIPRRGAGRPVACRARAGASRRPRSRPGGASTSTSSGRC